MKPLHVFRDMSQGIHAHVTKLFGIRHSAGSQGIYDDRKNPIIFR